MHDLAHARGDCAAVIRLVRERAGLVFRPDQRASVDQAIRRQMKAAGLEDPAAYMNLLLREMTVWDNLLVELTVGETYFFRAPGQFDFLRAEILPEIRQRCGESHVIRLWSAGCATGEEPYSLGVVCHESGLSGQVRLLATDISRPALLTARNARYRDWSLRDEGRKRMLPYLKRTPGDSDDCRSRRTAEYQLAERIRRLIHFEYLNLACDVYPSVISGTRDLDLILCRNVLIYFDPDTVAEVARRFWLALAPGGWLTTAASDPMLGDLAPFEIVAAEQGLFYRRPLEPVSPEREREIETNSPPVAPRIDEPAGGEQAATTVSDPLADAQRQLRDGNYARAAELSQLHLDKPQACVIYVEALANLDPLRAMEACQQAAQRHSLVPELHYLHGVLLMEGDRLQEAAQALRRVLYLDRSLTLAHFTLGSLQRRLGDLDAARRSFRNTCELCESRPLDEPLRLSETETAGSMLRVAQLQLRMI